MNQDADSAGSGGVSGVRKRGSARFAPYYKAQWYDEKYGENCYKYEKTQKPWMDKKLASYTSELLAEIESANDPSSATRHTERHE